MLERLKQYATENPGDVLGLTAMAIYMWPEVAHEKNMEINCEIHDFKNTINGLCNTSILDKNNYRRNIRFCAERSEGIFSVDLQGKINIDMEMKSIVSIDDFIKMIRPHNRKNKRTKRKSKFEASYKDIQNLVSEELRSIKQIENQDSSRSALETIHEMQMRSPIKGLRAVVHPEGAVEVIYP